jgi:Antibiotic biosynthesis monooxygenase
MIIVSGRIYVDPSDRDAFVARSVEAVLKARRAPGCLDFVVAADLLEPNRVNVYELWQSESKLEAFRGAGPGPEIASMIVRAEVSRHHIASSRPASPNRQERTTAYTVASR